MLLDREADREGLHVETLSTLDAIEALLPETSSLGLLPRALHWLDELFTRIGPVERWHYGEHESLVERIEGVLGTP